MSIEQAVAAALEHNASVRNAGLEVEKSEAKLFAQKTHRLPALTVDAIGGESLNRLSFDFREGAFGTYPSTGPIPNRDTKVEVARTLNTFVITQLRQPLTQLHKINLGVKLYEAELAADREQQRAARQAIAREVKAAYVDVVTAIEYVRVAKATVDLYTEVDREAKVRIAEKLVLEADVADAVAKLRGAKATQLAADNSLATARERLAYLVGRDIDVHERMGIGRDPAVVTDDRVLIENRPDVKRAKFQLDQAVLDARLKSADRIPDISLTIAHATPIHFDVLPTNLTTAGVVVSWEPVTWGRRKAEAREKLLSAEQAQNAVNDRRAAAAIEIAARKRKLDEALALSNVREVEIDAAMARARVVKVRFEQNAARLDEVLAAGAAVTEAFARAQEAISAWYTARADYEQAIGEE